MGSGVSDGHLHVGCLGISACGGVKGAELGEGRSGARALRDPERSRLSGPLTPGRGPLPAPPLMPAVHIHGALQAQPWLAAVAGRGNAAEDSVCP